jgi:hypothetical protein
MRLQSTRLEVLTFADRQIEHSMSLYLLQRKKAVYSNKSTHYNNQPDCCSNTGSSFRK